MPKFILTLLILVSFQVYSVELDCKENYDSAIVATYDTDTLEIDDHVLGESTINYQIKYPEVEISYYPHERGMTRISNGVKTELLCFYKK